MHGSGDRTDWSRRCWPQGCWPVARRRHRAPTSPAGAGAYAHLAELQRIIDAAGGTRSTPSPGYDAAVDHVAAVLRAAGWDVATPTYQVEGEPGSGYRNVVAQTRTGDPAHVVMAGAHLDSVPEGPGVNDNGSGVASLLQIAEQMGGSPGFPAMVRLAFWGSEEDDLDGSTGYVDGLDRAGRAAIALYVNLDMVASPNAGYFVQGGTGRRDEAGPAGSATVAQVLADELARVGAVADRDRFDGESDYDAFVTAGIPTGRSARGRRATTRPTRRPRHGADAPARSSTPATTRPATASTTSTAPRSAGSPTRWTPPCATSRRRRRRSDELTIAATHQPIERVGDPKLAHP